MGVGVEVLRIGSTKQPELPEDLDDGLPYVVLPRGWQLLLAL